jgi:hypothetical protein
MEFMRMWMTEIETKCGGAIVFLETDIVGDYVCYITKSDDGDYARLGYSKGSHLHLQTFSEGSFKHEIAHVAGLDHEWKRLDRDDWITIDYNNLNPEYGNNVLISDALLYNYNLYPFDFESITLYSYSAKSFSINGYNVLIGLKYRGNNKLSDIDIEKIIEIYAN